MNKKIEILSPAGSYEGMRAAMNAGSDAIYIGGFQFGARAYASNLDEETLLRAINETHIRGKKLYLTVNTLLKEEELQDNLYSFLKRFYEEGLDAVIVQDVGVMEFVHNHFPNLQIHASTQTTITMAEGANLLKENGVTRLVTARELSLKEIKRIRENTDIEIETFVHGALCYCYSGQCLMSSIIGGRSGNRGRCAQPCRMPYQFYSEDGKVSSEKEKYLLSPKDINTLAMIPDFIEAGIDSFKIEGRMKRPEYTAGVTALYRKAIDLYLDKGRDGFQAYLQSNSHEKDMVELQDLYSRGGFSEGYGKTYHGKKMMSLTRPNHSGVCVGEVAKKQGNDIGIKLSMDIHGQDILEIRNIEEESGHEFTVKDGMMKGSILRTYVGKIPSSRSKGKSMTPIQIGAMVYRTKNNDLLHRITTDYIENETKQPVEGIFEARLGQPIKFTLCYKDYQVTSYGEEVQAAQKQPMTEEKLRNPLMKFGDTPYYLEKLTVLFDEGIFVPVTWLNEVRRAAVNLLQKEVVQSYYRMLPEEVKEKESKIPNLVSDHEGTLSPGVVVGIQTRDQFETTMTFGEVTKVLVDYSHFKIEELKEMAKIAASNEKQFFLLLPHICRLTNSEKLKKDILNFYGENDITGFVAKNFEEVAFIQSTEALLREESQRTKAFAPKEIILNHNMYIYNKNAKKFWNRRGITSFTAPLELNSKELKAVGVEDSDLLVYGYMPLMISAQCLYESTGGCKKCQSGKQRVDYLVDRMGKKFYVQSVCEGCYNIIYNGQKLSLLRYADEVREMKPQNIRLDFVFESKAETKVILHKFIDGYCNGVEVELEGELLTAGHFKRGVE